MNEGMICVSVCAGTADEMIENIKRAEKFADVIEVRFDCMNKSDFNWEDPEKARPVLRKISEHHHSIPWITTFRTKEQGGGREISELERSNFWDLGSATELADLEEDLIADSLNLPWKSKIVSQHDFTGGTIEVDKIFDRLAQTSADVVKIAIQTDDITDAIPIWNLIKRSESTNKKVIPVAMGEAGKWTRILGTAHGAFLTYSALDADSETAPGQVTAEDMVGIFRVKELDEKTVVYGILGDPVSRSLSPWMLNPAFASHGINAVYLPLQVKNIDEFIWRMVKSETREVELNFGGFSVTMPHKVSIIKHLDEIDKVAEKIGAVNTVKIENDKVTGYNTDAYGFITPLKTRFDDLKDARVGVFGAGGSARACVYALKQENADVTVFARDVKKAKTLAGDFQVRVADIGRADLRDVDIVVDTTPLGMKGPLENETLFTAEQFAGVKFVYDLVTKPTDTPILREARIAGVDAIGGIEMLVAQGAKQFEIWTGQTAPVEIMLSAVRTRIQKLKE